MRAVLYCRVSTTEQTLNLSLETQEQACRTYCTREGYTVDRVFVDRGESAKTADRPAFQELLTYCRAHKGQVHAVIVYALTRFSRNSADHHAIAALLRGFGITLRSVTEPIDDSPSGKLMETILAGFAQFDNDVRAERTKAGMKAAVARGRWVWGPPLGYRKQNVRGAPSLVPDPQLAPIVRRAFELAAAGTLSGRALHTHLQRLGLHGRAGAPLARSRFLAMLHNPVYAGRIRIAGWAEETRGDFEPIVTDALFQRVQQQLVALRTNPGRRHRNHPDFPLRRFVRCATCQRVLTGSWSRGRAATYAHYHCIAGCTRVRKDELEDAFLQLLERLTPAPQYLAYIRRVALDLWREERDADRRHRGALQTTLTQIDGQLQQLDRAYIYDRAIDAATYQRERDDLRQRRVTLQMEVGETLIGEQELEALLDFAEHALSHASAIWTAAASTEERMGIQATLFPDGLVWAPAQRRRGSNVQRGVPIAARFIEPRSCFAFYQLEKISEAALRVVGHPDRTWHQLIHDLQQLRSGFPAAA